MFHWHVVDSQSFPLEVAEFPELSQQGAYSTDQIYSTSDMQDIISYAGAVSHDTNLLSVGHTLSFWLDCSEG